MSSSSTFSECYICDSSILTAHEVTVTTDCGHTFHRRCAQHRVDSSKKGDCKTCRKPAALAKALFRDDDDSVKSWSCAFCSMAHMRSITRCGSCGAFKHGRSMNSPVHRMDAAVVYIPDLPTNIGNDVELERHIRNRIEKTTKLKPRQIKCYSSLGVGIMHVDSDETRSQFINDIENIVLDLGEDKAFISFAAKLELISYVVVEDVQGKNPVDLPTSYDISRRWADLHRGETTCICEQLSASFPKYL